MISFQEGNSCTLHRLLSLFFVLIIGTEIAYGHSYPRNISIPGLGDLTGSYNTHTMVISFLGIPYAKPPIGELRFELPEAISWNDTRDATKTPPDCIQNSDKTSAHSEDCLYLNIYVPGNMTDENSSLPVMVWIHGGDFNTGSANSNNVKSLARFGQVIVVTFNYRLNIFGFLSSGHKNLPGNAGLHDQVMVLKWIKANIHPFGGDPNKVTIFGQSAGAVSIYILLASPTHTDGLFSRAIMQSGMIRPFTDTKDAFGKVANLTSCPHIHINGKSHAHSGHQQMECLKNKTTEELLQVVRNPHVPTLGPVIDKMFLHSTIPEQLAAKKNIVPCLIGLTNHELVLKANETIKDMDTLKKHLASLGGESFSPMIVELILSKFLTNDLEKTYMNVYNSRFVASIQNLTMLISRPKETFMYYFTHHPSFSTMNKYTGARHSNELPFVFGEIFKKNSSATSDEEILSKDLIAIWSSFARDGVPHLPSGVKWPPYEKPNRAYVELAVNITADNVKKQLHESDRIFWNEMVPKMIRLLSKPFGHHPFSGGSSDHTVVSDYRPGILGYISESEIIILHKMHTIKLAATRHKRLLEISTNGGNVSKVFTNDANKSGTYTSVESKQLRKDIFFFISEAGYA